MKFIPQHDQMDCGPACLAMLASHYHKKYSLGYLREASFITREGVSISGIAAAAQKIGLQSFVVQLSLDHLKADNDYPCILHWNQNHFVVLYRVKKKLLSGKTVYQVADPAHGFISFSEEEFTANWLVKGKGVAVFLHPGDQFYFLQEPHRQKQGIRYFWRYLSPYRRQLAEVVLALFISSLFMLVFPFLTQTLIDKGVMARNLHLISLLIFAQAFLFIGATVIDIVRNWVTLYLGARVNLQIVSDFLKKVLRLPLSFFDTRMKGDFNQRIQDQARIESFLTSQSLVTLFSLIHFGVFFFVLFYYNHTIVVVYALLTLAAVGWSILFQQKRKVLDYYRFQGRSANQESINELVNGIQEIKLNHLEEYKTREWEKIQVKLLGINLRMMKVDQLQMTGFDCINQFKNILVTLIAAYEVVAGHISLGAMLGISYIIGQMNSPVNQLILFFRSLQDARLSLERLSEVQAEQEEEQDGQMHFNRNGLTQGSGMFIKHLHFRYGSPASPLVIKNLTLFIPEGKITAIVGASGSGKTTLMKLLLRFYHPSAGEIKVDGLPLCNLSARSWRMNCGVVMQDGYIFADTIERNIVGSDEQPDAERLKHAIRMANIEAFIHDLPLGLHTRIGASGNGISGGQKQRLLIARAIYKNPQYLFFDEATSSLDAENERIIHDHLYHFFKGKTVMIIAHRLSTVKQAHQIVVLKNGQIVEKGTHQELVENRSEYFRLVKNQLELGV